jgi:hypothetical protein
MLPAFSGEKSNGGICVDVNGKFRISGGFTSMKVSQLDRMLYVWKEKFISLLGLNCSHDLFFFSNSCCTEFVGPGQYVGESSCLYL